INPLPGGQTKRITIMKLSLLSATLLCAAGALLLTPSVRAQTNNPSTNAPQVRPRNRPMVAENRVSYLSQQLNLTEDQKPKVRAVYEAEAKALEEIPREQRRDKFAALQEETSKKLKEILTPEQWTKYQALPSRGPRPRD